MKIYTNGLRSIGITLPGTKSSCVIIVTPDSHPFYLLSVYKSIPLPIFLICNQFDYFHFRAFVSFLFKEKFHEKTIKDIAFIDEERVIFGGFDKKLSLISINQNGELKCDPQELKIAMQCQGMQINGVVREEERLLLEKLIAKASS